MKNLPAITKALAVFVLDPKIRSWLQANDPKALAQATKALKEEGVEVPKDPPSTERRISLNIGKGQQDVNYTEVLEVAGSKLRIQIRSDSYEQQCHSRIGRWNGEEWKHLHSLVTRKTPNGLAYHPQGGTNEKHFKADREELLRVAKEVLT